MRAPQQGDQLFARLRLGRGAGEIGQQAGKLLVGQVDGALRARQLDAAEQRKPEVAAGKLSIPVFVPGWARTPIATLLPQEPTVPPPIVNQPALYRTRSPDGQANRPKDRISHMLDAVGSCSA